jgi:glycine oxidase
VTSSGSGNRISVAIAGGGIIGLTIAWKLLKAGNWVTIYDQGNVGGEASWAGAGMLAPGGEIDQPGSSNALAIESLGLYSAFVRELQDASGLPIDYQECGALDLAYSDDELAALDRRAERQHAWGIHSRHINSAQITTFWPRVRREGLTGGRFYPNDAIVNPRELTHALKCVCLKRGATINERCRVDAIDTSGPGASVQTEKGAQRFEVAVIAAGAWSSQIAVTGVPCLPQSEPVKGHLIGYKQPDQTCNTIIRHGQTYLLQRGNGLLIAGSSMERVGFNREVNPVIAFDLAKRAGFLLPHLSETSPADSWMGFRPASDDLHIGSWHSPRLYLAYGHFRNGILLAPATAERIASDLTANWQTR